MRVVGISCAAAPTLIATYLLLMHCSAANAQQNTQTAIEEALQYNNVILGIIDSFPLHKLSAQLQAEAAAIRANTASQLQQCAELAQSNVDIWRYKVCSSEQHQLAMAKMGALMERGFDGYRGGAATLRVFWWHVWQWLRLLW